MHTIRTHLAKKIEQAFLSHVGRDGSEMAVSVQSFFVRYRLLASENGLYELADTFCHVGPTSLRLIRGKAMQTRFNTLSNLLLVYNNAR